MSLHFLNNIRMLGAYLIYVTLFSSNIYMLTIHLFYVTQKTYICYCSPWHMLFKNPTTCTCVFFGCNKPVITRHSIQFHSVTCHHPTQYPISQCHNGIIEVLWLGIMIMFQLRHHRETACHSQPSVITTWQISVGGGPHLTAAHSVRQDMCEVTL